MEKYFTKATLDEVFENVTNTLGERTAILFDGQEITYRQLQQLVHALTLKLHRMGIHKGDKIALLLPNCYEYLCLYFAAFLIGAWVIPINSRIKERELRNILTDANPKVIILEKNIANRDYEEILEGIKASLSGLEHVIVRGESANPKHLDFAELITLPDDLAQRFQAFPRPEIDESDIALLAYTSGTTNAPKGVMITHHSLVYTSYHCGRMWFGDTGNTDIQKVAFSIAPLYAAQGFLAVLIDLVAGITMKWTSTFNPNEILRILSRGETNYLHTQPTMWLLLLSSPIAKFVNWSCLEVTVVSGSVCSSHLARRIEETTGCMVFNAYGLVESSGTATITRPTDPTDIRLNTVGRPLPGVELKIVDSERREVQRGEVGELAIRGYVMAGYYNNPERTRQVLDADGWLYSGDLACYYQGGDSVRILGRVDDMIIRGGFNVLPMDIEEVILELPGVQDVAVIGRREDILGEAIIAFVVKKPGAVISRGSIFAHCREALSDYKLPDEIIFVKQLPTILSGKIQKNVLREWANSTVPSVELAEL